MENIKSIPIRIKILFQYYCLQMSVSKMAGTPYGGFIYNFYRSLFNTILSRLFKKDLDEILGEIKNKFQKESGPQM